MNEIRKALQLADEMNYEDYSGTSFYDKHKAIIDKAYEALAFLPSEGETRDDPCPKCGVVGCAECYGTGRLSGYQVHANTGEPVPSSEKALREALRLLERWYTWQAEATEVRMADDDYLNIVTPTAALLASSPASVIPRPEDVKRPGPRAPSSVNPGPCNTVAPAPGAPKC